MHILRQMQKGLSDERGCDGQFQKQREWNGMYPVHGMREELPQECSVIIGLEQVTGTGANAGTGANTGTGANRSY